MNSATFDQVRAPVVVLDRAGIVRHWNAACAARTGRRATDVHGRPFWEVVDAADADAVRSGFAGEAPIDALEVGYRAADGSTRRMRLASSVVRGDGGDIEAIVLTGFPLGEVTHHAARIEDASRRVRDELAFRELFEQASDGIFLADTEGRYTDVNPAACRMLGYSREQLVGKTVMDIIPEEDVARLVRHVERLNRGATDVSEWTLRRADGTWLSVELSTKTLADGSWEAFARDITERKRASEALAASEAKFRQIVSVSVDAIISVDEDEKIVLFNEGAERIFGYRAIDVIGGPLEVLLPVRYRAAHHGHLRAFTASGVPARPMAQRTPVLARRSNGEEFHVQASISQFVDGERRILTAVLRDISLEVRALEEERCLGDVSAVLAGSLDVEVTLAELSRLAARHLADVCIVDFLHGDSTRVVRVASRAPEHAELASALEAYALDREKPYPGSTVWQTGAPELVEHVTQTDLVRASQDVQHLALLRAVGPRSLLAVPMLARGHRIGVLTLFSSGRTYDRRDLELAVEVSRRAATALDNALLHDALTRAHADLGQHLRELQEAQEKIRTLTGLLPVCAWCGLIRDAESGGTWKRLEQFVSERSSAEFTHGICPSCATKVGRPQR